MAYLIAAAAYLMFVVSICLFLKGGSMRKSPEPPNSHVEVDYLQSIQLEAPLATVFEPECPGEWSGEISVPAVPLAQPSQGSAQWHLHPDSSRL